MRITIGDYDFILTTLSSTPIELDYPTVWILFVVEFIAISFSVMYTPFVIRVFEKTPLFHKNLIRISQAMLLAYYPSIIARLVLLLSEIRVLKQEGNLFDSIMIVVAGFVRSSSMTVVGMYLPSVIIERGFASKFITDYENVRRSWICRTIILSVYLLSGIYTACVMLGFINDMLLAGLASAFLLISCIAYVFLFRRNFAKLRDINRGVIPKNIVYTLSTKFQLTENLKVMKILMRLSIVEAVSALFVCLFFALAATTSVNQIKWNQMCWALMNVSLAISFDVFIVIFMNSLGLYRFRSIVPLSSKIGTDLKVPATDEHRGASNTYFDQLTSKWKI